MAKMRTFLMAFALLSMAYVFSLEAGEKPNCKLTVRTYYKDGDVDLKIEKIHKATRLDCKKEAHARRENKDPDDISNIKASFSFTSLISPY